MLQVLLRELTRDVIELLRVFVGSTSFPTIPASQLATLSATKAHGFSNARKGRSATARIAALHASSGSPADSPGHSPRRGEKAADGKGHPSLNSVPWEQTMACALLPVRCTRAVLFVAHCESLA